MSKTYKDSRTARTTVKNNKPLKAARTAYKRLKTEEVMRLEPRWKSGIEHRLGRDD